MRMRIQSRHVDRQPIQFGTSSQDGCHVFRKGVFPFVHSKAYLKRDERLTVSQDAIFGNRPVPFEVHIETLKFGAILE